MSPAKLCRWSGCWLVMTAAVIAEDAKPTPSQVEFFEKKIRPLLVEKCFDCHSQAKKIKGGLSLDSKQGWEKGGDTGPAIEPGKPDDSLLIKAVRYTDSELKMPPNGKLKDTEIQLLEDWVKQGAPDPRTSPPAKSPEKGFPADAARTHWAYQPLQNVSAPAVKDEAWPLTSIDRFILASLEQRNLPHSPDADRAVWLRRVSLDLTGLPPTVEELNSFLADADADPYPAAVDRLLASRSFGERWARAWLDLVGYADQIGSANNVPAEHAWRYRDYLIESFTQDKPYDVLIREQLAGDLLTAGSIEERRAQLTATGFLVLGNVNIVDADKLVLRMDLVDQQLEKIGKTFLGMTLQCVRCHDHKFDPITQRDYYGLAGILASTESTYKDRRGVWSSVTKIPLPETLEEFTARESALKAHDKQLASLQQERTTLEQQLAKVREALPNAPDTADGQPAGTKTKAELDKEQTDLQGKLKGLQQTQWHLEYLRPAPPLAFGLKDAPEIRDTFIQIRGNPHVTGDVVPRGFVQVATHGPAPKIPADASGRAQLADWLTGPANPLVARTAVNRIWQKLFGHGLVSSTDYFGLRSESPSHPELLDHLAKQFIDEGWSFKKLMRNIVLSRVYRQTSDVTESTRSAFIADEDNRYLWRMSPRRLEAEMLRDSVLAVSGQLQQCTGGPALNPQFRENVGGLDPADVNPISFSLRKFREEQSLVRTVYLPVVRSSDQQGPGDVLNFFDFPQPALMTSDRAATAVSSQALFLMNGPLLRDAAKKLGDELRTSSNVSADADRLSAVWLRVLNRSITESEAVDAQQFLATAENLELGWQSLVQALIVSHEFLFRL